METIGEIIDKLNVVNIKIYHLVDLVEDKTKDDKEVANAAKKMALLNRQRSKLKNEIDLYFGNKDQEVKI